MRRRPALRIAAACFFACVCLVGIDALLFRTNLYRSILEPDSSTGTFELTLFREQEFQKRHPNDRLVVTFGDSRFAYLPRLANEITAESGLVLRHAGIGGSDARTWYYMLRELDPTASRYRAVVFGVTDYDDEDEPLNPLLDIRALHYVIARLTWADVVPFALSFPDRHLRWEALRGAVLKGIVLQTDIHDFLTHPKERIHKAKVYRRFYDEWTYGFVETDKTVEGLAIDWKNWTVQYPPGADENVRSTVEANLMRRDDPPDGHMYKFRSEWFGRMIDRYRNSRTKVIFVRLPRGPIARPEGLVQKPTHSIRDFASRSNVLLAGEHIFEPLEQPALFKDGDHLNRAGIARFSPMLAREIARLLREAHAF